MEKVIILLGPTGVGKTAVSLLLAQALGSEIISADSMQIYRHMDIGTAKPSVEELRLVKHHMIDVAAPWESFSTGAYIAHVKPIIDALLERKRVPIIVGGTGLYIKAMTRGIFSGPSADWEMRSELLKKEEKEKGVLYRQLQALDPAAASEIMPADTRRIIRALEVCMKSDLTMTEMRREYTAPLPYEYIKIGLTRERKELYRMVDERVDAMIARGLVDEAAMIIKMIEDAETRRRGDAGKDNLSPYHHIPVSSYTAMQAIGYKEIAAHLSGEISLHEAIGLIKQRSRNYAKRQFTWFKKEEGIHWIDITGMHDPGEIKHACLRRYNICGPGL